MAIISYDKDTIIEYIPEFQGNRDSESPCIVKLKFISYGKTQEFARKIGLRTKGLKNQERIIEISQEIQKEQFIYSVQSIEGYQVIGENGNPKDVTDAKELYETADNALIEEILKAMEDSQKLTENQRKNS